MTDLAEFQRTNSVVLVADQGNSAANYLAALNQRLAAMKSEHDLLQMLTLDQSLNRQQDAGDSLPVASDSTDASAGTSSGQIETDYLKPSSSCS